jgi:hypothetical protein
VVTSLPLTEIHDFCKEIVMPSRELSFPVFDADNHMYEPQEALTKFLPDKRKNVIDYVQVRGRTKIVVRGHISEYIPNPTFEKVARPGVQDDYFRNGAQGKTYREVLGEPMKEVAKIMGGNLMKLMKVGRPVSA